MTTTTPTFVGPDQDGRYHTRTQTHHINLFVRADGDTQNPRVFVFADAQWATDPRLVDLKTQESYLPMERRFAEPGTYPEVDQLKADIATREAAATLAVAREIVPALAGLVDGDLDAAIAGAVFNPTAGCECPEGCAPGVCLPVPLTVNGALVDVWVSPVKPQEK